ncbi:hypothetical protein DPMN_030719 [Dreissena polymorpha]|uniref:Uncharacterized protein n=1 Tax=Dreissena polymorpha TaxID=45954 RepID=A0A9D4RIC5_DREPO|nr:hypothetical protein DPMN_030719 [Dreissena polymorpha]
MRAVSPGLLCDGVNRQYISCGLHPGTGVNTLSLPVSGNWELTRSLQVPQHLSLVQTLTRSSQPMADGLSRKHQFLPLDWTLH